MLVTAMCLVSMNTFMLCHSVTHATDLKAEKVISNQHRFTVIITIDMYLELLVKIIHTVHYDQASKYITAYFSKIDSKSEYIQDMAESLTTYFP